MMAGMGWVGWTGWSYADGAVLDGRGSAGGLGVQQRVSEQPPVGRAGRGGDPEAPLRAGRDQPRRICADQRNAAHSDEVNAMKYRWMGIITTQRAEISEMQGYLTP